MELLHPWLPTNKTTKLIYDDIDTRQINALLCGIEGLFLSSVSNRKFFLFPATKSLIFPKKKTKQNKTKQKKKQE